MVPEICVSVGWVTAKEERTKVTTHVSAGWEENKRKQPNISCLPVGQPQKKKNDNGNEHVGGVRCDG